MTIALLLLLLAVAAVLVAPHGVAARRPTRTPRPRRRKIFDDDDVVSDCFPAAATVVTADGVVTRMDALTVGTVVVTGPDGSTSPVFALSHADPAGDAGAWVTLTTAVGELTLSAGHYVPVRRGGVAAAGAPRLVAAAAIAIGDAVGHVPPPPRASSAATANESTCAAANVGTIGSGWVIVARTTVTAAAGGRGLYNPHTLDGSLVVDGIVTSTYTTAVAPAVADVALAAGRAAYWWGAGATVGGRLLPALGGVRVPQWVRGRSVY